MMSNRGRLRADPGPGRFVSRHECRFVSRLPASEVGVVRQVVDQLADHETVVRLGRHGDVTSALRGVKYTFVTAIEACVDGAQHICATEGWGPPAGVSGCGSGPEGSLV